MVTAPAKQRKLCPLYWLWMSVCILLTITFSWLYFSSVPRPTTLITSTYITTVGKHPETTLEIVRLTTQSITSAIFIQSTPLPLQTLLFYHWNIEPCAFDHSCDHCVNLEMQWKIYGSQQDQSDETKPRHSCWFFHRNDEGSRAAI